MLKHRTGACRGVRLRTQFSPARHHAHCLSARDRPLIVLSSSSSIFLFKPATEDATALFIASCLRPKVVNIFLIFSRPKVLRLRYELMCLMNEKNNDGGIHPLDISVPLSCASASHSDSAVRFFFLLRAGPPAPAPAMPKIPLNKWAPSACPYFYIYIADEAWQSPIWRDADTSTLAEIDMRRMSYQNPKGTNTQKKVTDVSCWSE